MRPTTMLLVLWSVICIGLRLEAARVVDLGDSEALYAVYSLFPAPSFLDHPGLIGKLYGLLGKPPEARDVHTATAMGATLFPWLLRAALRFTEPRSRDAEENGRRSDRATLVALLFATVPVVAVGLFALTPDWPLSLCVLSATAFALRGESEPERRTLHLFAAGALMALSAYAKVTGYVFVVALAFAWLRAKTPARGAGFVGMAIGFAPSIPMWLYESQHGFPMLGHRLAPSALGVAQGLGMATIGQLLYLSPIVCVLLCIFARRFVRSGVAPTLNVLVLVPAALLLLVAALSPQAEPHWMAPLLIPLAFAAYRTDPASFRDSRWVRGGFGLAAVLTVLVHIWVLVPQASRLLPESARRHDISRELFGQNVLRDALLRTAQEASSDGITPVFVGPHWTLCARIRLALPAHRFEVGCITAEQDDFDTWAKDVWKDAPRVIWVTDDRFEAEDSQSPLPSELIAYTQVRRERARVFRGGAPSRVFSWRTLELPSAQLPSDEPQKKPHE